MILKRTRSSILATVGVLLYEMKVSACSQARSAILGQRTEQDLIDSGCNYFSYLLILGHTKYREIIAASHIYALVDFKRQRSYRERLWVGFTYKRRNK